MENKVLGLHHITAIASDAQQNYDFYTRVLGQRLVKKTVNFDDPGTYHFYFGDEVGTPGTILTFFPWKGVQKGRPGTGMATEIGYTVPKESLQQWQEHLQRHGVANGPVVERFGEAILPLQDGDGLQLNLIGALQPDSRKPWTTPGIDAGMASRGFHSTVLTLRNINPTAAILTDLFGYRLLQQEGDRYRFVTDAVDTANIIDLVEAPNGASGINAGGTNHHIAFRVRNEEVLLHFRERVRSRGLNITDKIDRNYFYSLYFREPGGVLFELATDNPGFAVDEPVQELGKGLKLPAQYEQHRKEIEQVLPPLNQ